MGWKQIKGLFATALSKQHMKEATEGFMNIMAGHHDLHVARWPYNSDLTASF